MASGTSTSTSVLDSRVGRMRAGAMLTVDWLVVNALAPVDPLARWARTLRALAERGPDLTVLPGAQRRTGTTIRGFASLPVSMRRHPVRPR